MACSIPANDLSNRQIYGLIAACLAVAIGLYCVVYFDYIMQISINDRLEHDVKTVTAGDYTVEFKISTEFFDSWDIN